MTQGHEDSEPRAGDAVAPKPCEPEETQADTEPSVNDFHPIKIKGEPLSVVIIRERRERPW